jgi:hypothetical protein
MSQPKQDEKPSSDLSRFVAEAVRISEGEVSSGITGRDPKTGEFVHQRHNDCGFVTLADAGPSGDSRYEMAGRPPQNEAGVREVCLTLARALSDATGVEWTADPQRSAELSVWTDWVIRNSRGVLPVQVTRVALWERWQTVGATGSVDGSASAPDAAAEMWAAIERKLRQQDSHTVLALDIRHPGFHGFPAVLNEFRVGFGARLEREVRYAQVWAVGYAPELSHCLYRSSDSVF